MSAGFGVRVIHTGPNRLAVMGADPAALSTGLLPDWKATIDRGEPIVITTETNYSSAWNLVKEFERLGATAEAYVTDPAPAAGTTITPDRPGSPSRKTTR